MILVTLGTQDKNFVRLLEKIDQLINNGLIKDKVIVQAGFTKYNSENMEIFDLIPQDEFNDLMDKADIIITHGGVGNIIGTFFGVLSLSTIQISYPLQDLIRHGGPVLRYSESCLKKVLRKMFR